MARSVICIGGGPAGLTSAYLLSKKGVPVTVLEADPRYVGGISRTVEYKGFHFDVGGHRFFSKSREVEDLWSELLPNDMLERPRSSRIFYGGQFYSYPLKAFEALTNLGFFNSTLCVLSYAQARAFPHKDPKNLEDWVSNQFGKRLFSIFFKTYTEKVWGMDCKDISADWAAQRIKGLSLGSAIWNAVMPKRKPKDRSQVIKTLIDTFRYPRKGPGMMWDAAKAKVIEQGGKVMMGTRVTALSQDPSSKLWTAKYETVDGKKGEVQATDVISSAPIREILANLSPKPKSLPHAEALRYRDFLTVSLILKDREIFSDNWIYIHDPSVKVGRIQNFKSWSPEMVPDPKLCCYGLEYFCFEGDGLWTSSDADLIKLAGQELEKLGLASQSDVLDGCVVRQHKAYPVYDDEYATHVEAIRRDIEGNYPGFHFVGRNGMHKYNNQDHAMMTAMLAARNIIEGKNLYDVWEVNQDAEYHEAGKAGESTLSSSGASGLRSVPSRVSKN
jgi:protoporphyrinogen oxidase